MILDTRGLGIIVQIPPTPRLLTKRHPVQVSVEQETRLTYKNTSGSCTQPARRCLSCRCLLALMAVIHINAHSLRLEEFSYQLKSAALQEQHTAE